MCILVSHLEKKESVPYSTTILSMCGTSSLSMTFQTMGALAFMKIHFHTTFFQIGLSEINTWRKLSDTTLIHLETLQTLEEQNKVISPPSPITP